MSRLSLLMNKWKVLYSRYESCMVTECEFQFLISSGVTDLRRLLGD